MRKYEYLNDCALKELVDILFIPLWVQTLVTLEPWGISSPYREVTKSDQIIRSSKTTDNVKGIPTICFLCSLPSDSSMTYWHQLYFIGYGSSWWHISISLPHSYNPQLVADGSFFQNTVNLGYEILCSLNQRLPGLTIHIVCRRKMCFPCPPGTWPFSNEAGGRLCQPQAGLPSCLCCHREKAISVSAQNLWLVEH